MVRSRKKSNGWTQHAEARPKKPSELQGGQQIKSWFFHYEGFWCFLSEYFFAVRLSVSACIARYSQILAPIYAIFDRNVHEKYVDLIL